MSFKNILLWLKVYMTSKDRVFNRFVNDSLKSIMSDEDSHVIGYDHSYIYIEDSLKGTYAISIGYPYSSAFSEIFYLGGNSKSSVVLLDGVRVAGSPSRKVMYEFYRWLREDTSTRYVKPFTHLAWPFLEKSLGHLLEIQEGLLVCGINATIDELRQPRRNHYY